MKAQNLDKLSPLAKDLIAALFTLPCGWTNTYMVEVYLDDPIKNILDGGDNLECHGGNGSKCYMKHAGEPNWAIVHTEDEDWIANLGDAENGLTYVKDHME